MELYIRIGYAVIAAATVLCIVFSRRGEKELRFIVDRFAAAFLRLSNYASPEIPRRRLAVRRSGGRVEPLPVRQQPEELRFILERGAAKQSEELFCELEAATAEIKWRCRRNRRLREQFCEPLETLCYIAYVFRKGALDLSSIDDTNKETAFNSFLEDQLKHRMALLRRISREFNGEFLSLNKRYDLERAERAQAQKERYGMKEQLSKGEKKL